MNRIRFYLSIIALLFSAAAFSQEQTTKTIKKISIQDVIVQRGSFASRTPISTPSDFNKLAPNSLLLKNDMSGFSQSNRNNVEIRNSFSVIMGLRFSDKENTSYRANPLMRLGVSYYSGTFFRDALQRKDRIAYDTLTSSQTGQALYVDSVVTRRYGMNYSAEQIRLDGSVIFSTNPEARWALYSGFGATAGVSVNAKTEIYYTEDTNIETRYPEGYTQSSRYRNSDNTQWESFRNKNNFSASAYVPLGVDFRIGKKSEFWKRTHLFYEIRPGIDFTSVPEIGTVVNSGIQFGSGLRVSWE